MGLRMGVVIGRLLRLGEHIRIQVIATIDLHIWDNMLDGLIWCARACTSGWRWLTDGDRSNPKWRGPGICFYIPAGQEGRSPARGSM